MALAFGTSTVADADAATSPTATARTATVCEFEAMPKVTVPEPSAVRRYWPLVLPPSSVSSLCVQPVSGLVAARVPAVLRSEEHTSELQSLMRISYAVFCLKKKNTTQKD